MDAYKGVKALIKRKFGQTELPEAIEKLEKKPESKGLREMVKKEIETAKADQDPEIRKELEKLLKIIEQTPNAQEKLAKYNLTIRDSRIGVVGDYATIQGGIHF